MLEEKPKNNKIKITLQDVLEVMHEGFGRMATKNDIKDMATKSDIEEINYRLDVIEGKLFIGHNNRIENLEDDMRKVKTRLDM